jgi:hypothetical protein
MPNFAKAQEEESSWMFMSDALKVGVADASGIMECAALHKRRARDGGMCWRGGCGCTAAGPQRNMIATQYTRNSHRSRIASPRRRALAG